MLASCAAGAVEVAPYDRAPGSEGTCARLVDALPDVVADAVRRDPAPPDPGTAAWGDPAIVLRCGLPEVVGYRADAQLFPVDGVEWFAVPGRGGWFFSTVGREVVVEVAVPEAYAPESTVLADLAPALTSTVPATGEG